MNSYYKSSWKSNIASVIMYIILWLVISILLAFLYSLVNWFNPILYFQVLWVIARWWMLNRSVNKLAKIFKIRNSKLVWISIFIFFVISLYIHWSIYSSFVLNATWSDNFGSWKNQIWITYISTDFEKVISDILGIMMNPSVIVEVMKSLYHQWMRTLGGNDINGIFIVIIWIIEAICLGIYMILDGVGQSKKPFSEVANKWFAEKKSWKLKMPLDITNDNDIKNIKVQLENGDYQFLKWISKWSIDMDEYCEFKLYILDEDTENAYISIDNVYETINNKWETETDEKEIVKFLSIPNSLAQSLDREYC